MHKKSAHRLCGRREKREAAGGRGRLGTVPGAVEPPPYSGKAVRERLEQN